MNYLGVEITKPKVAFFDFTCCEGCQLQIANKEDTLPDFLNLVEVVNFREVSSYQGQDYEIAFIEGSISRQDQVERLKKIRAQAKILVAYGTCAAFGGVNKMANIFSAQELNDEVYGPKPKDTLPVMAVSEVVPVDLTIPGCPVSKEEVEKIVVHLVLGAEFAFPKYAVCMECKQHLNHCLLDEGKVCLGTIARAGCDAPCPTHKTPCWGCRGPADVANWDSLAQILKQKGFSQDEVQSKMNFFHSLNEVVK